MNPLTNVKNLQKLNERELSLGLTSKKSWHDQYKDSAWVFIGGLPYDLTEGDIVCVFSQYGEIVNINLVRDQKTGKSKGFCFLCYEDQRSTILAVDNLNGFKLLGRILRVDHVEEYRKPKDHGDEDELTRKLRDEGCAPKVASSPEQSPDEDPMPIKTKREKKKKEKKAKKKKKKKKVNHSSDSEDDSEPEEKETKYVKVKKEKYDSGYDKALKASSGVRKRSLSSESSESEEEQKLTRSRHTHRYEERRVQDERSRQGYRDETDRGRQDYRDDRRRRDVDRDSNRQSEDYGRQDGSSNRQGDRDTDRYRDEERNSVYQDRGGDQRSGYRDRDRGREQSSGYRDRERNYQDRGGERNSGYKDRDRASYRESRR